MFEYIEVENNIFMVFDKVKVWVEDGKIHYMVDALMSKQVVIEDEICDIAAEDLFNKLESLHISSWDKHYEPKDCCILDGESWTVKYKREGEKIIKKTGENAWPREWKNLLKLMKSITGEIGEMY